MPRELLAPAIALLVLTAGCTALGGSTAAITVENERSVAYTMTVYVVEEPVGAGNVSFRATDGGGDRETVELSALGTEGPYYDVRLAEEWDATVRERTIPANATTTASFEAWDAGETVVSLFAGPEGRLVRVDYADCPHDAMEQTVVFSDGPENGVRTSCS